MKRLLYILNTLIAMLFFVSCEDESAVMPSDDQQCHTILVSVPNPADTRATYKESGENIAVVWEKGDVIKIGSNEFVFKEMKGTNGLFFHYGDLAGDKTKATFGSSVDGSAIQTQTKNNHCREVLEGTVPGDYNFAVNAAKDPIPLYPAQNMSLLHIQTKSPAMLLGESMLKISGLDKDYTVKLGRDHSLVFADQGDSLNIYVVVPAEKSISGTLKFYFYAYDEIRSNAEEGDEYHYYMKCNGAITTKNNEVVKMPLPIKPTHIAIQMGLPSGMKWATMNVGATKESEGGDSYTWGATNTNSFISVNKTYFELSGTVLDEYKRLKPEYDAATESWGDSWVMPTSVEAHELANKCTWTSATKDGVSGYIVSNGSKSIFLPSSTNYWLSNLVNNNNENIDKVAYSLYFDNNGGKISNEEGRSTKRFIRPILASSRNTQSYKLAFEDIEGTLSGEFSVSATKKIKFSKGNLQYQASTNTWRFADNQYDIRGLENNNISSTYEGWIDLFGWGTSGWNSGAKAYQPWSTSKNAADYNVGNSATKSLTGDCVNADWGVYNRISNGGDEAGLWRILTGDESNYLINSRTNAAKLRTKATVNGVPGVLLFPDGWTTPSDISVTMNVKERFKTNVYTAEQFEYLEFLGVVFLPAGGYRNEVTTNQLGEGGSTNSYDGENITGSYWTSSRKDGSNALCYVFKNKNDNSNKAFYDNVIVAKGNCALNGGCNVRLIHDK